MNAKASPKKSGEKPVLDIKNLTKRYGSFTALNDLTLSLDAGQILGVIGPNGAGKTTTIKILVGLSRPTSGTATIDGVDCVEDAREMKRLVGYMPDKFGSYDNMRVSEYLDFFGAAFGMSTAQRASRIKDVMQMTNTEYMKDRFVESLSHGMQQRVGLARTLLHDPKVLILDEPVNGLDPQSRIEMRDLLIELAGQGKTLMVTSHILPELARICQQVAIITNGTLRAFGTVEDIGSLVSQQRTVEAHLLKAEDVKSAAKVIRASIEDGAEVVEARAESIVRFRTASTEEQLAKMLVKLFKAGVFVSQFREVQTDLEEAFMSFTSTPPSSSTKSPAGVTSDV
ncbi:putative ABC transporter ATP-binding protein YbhF [Symmachiella macrocystis]|uniref:Putative ABC transporter ATP-binding protein YbhF n=1 Tax=Symmachiella macrocystis TaxID=2527985 RepID=A0A5C6BV69_9PLAN|nr:ABC transporter ATP-binding protein [Symmachiella macrocystis]TWU14574.1 putative ABC transporter ATP-binding protein YbhF [Symmachiella macrocystis]